MMTNIKITAFWDVMPHSLIAVYWVNEKHQSQIHWLLKCWKAIPVVYRWSIVCIYFISLCRGLHTVSSPMTKLFTMTVWQLYLISFRCVMWKTEMTIGAGKSSNRRAVMYTWKSWSTIFGIWRKHLDRNATNLDKHLEFQTWRGRKALITHFWITLTSVLPETKSMILYVWQESHKYPQVIASNYKENMLSWGRSSW